MNILVISANPKSVSDSFTLQGVESVKKALLAKYPKATIEDLDLYKAGIKPLDAEGLATMDNDDFYGRPLAEQFKNADITVWTTPMWNFSVPGIVKDYIDTIMIAGILFSYTPTVHGLLEDGKKSIIVSARGGDYSQSPMSDIDFVFSYLTSVLGFLNVKDVLELPISNTARPGAEVSPQAQIDVIAEKVSEFLS